MCACYVWFSVCQEQREEGSIFQSVAMSMCDVETHCWMAVILNVVWVWVRVFWKDEVQFIKLPTKNYVSVVFWVTIPIRFRTLKRFVNFVSPTRTWTLVFLLFFILTICAFKKWRFHVCDSIVRGLSVQVLIQFPWGTYCVGSPSSEAISRLPAASLLYLTLP